MPVLCLRMGTEQHLERILLQPDVWLLWRVLVRLRNQLPLCDRPDRRFHLLRDGHDVPEPAATLGQSTPVRHDPFNVPLCGLGLEGLLQHHDHGLCGGVGLRAGDLLPRTDHCTLDLRRALLALVPEGAPQGQVFPPAGPQRDEGGPVHDDRGCRRPRQSPQHLKVNPSTTTVAADDPAGARACPVPRLLLGPPIWPCDCMYARLSAGWCACVRARGFCARLPARTPAAERRSFFVPARARTPECRSCASTRGLFAHAHPWEHRPADSAVFARC
mmetsp:Transcript_19121/g.60814  ORF Transcript_19121/g.60814 Transcript_19121/m.60814 type:complete len:274 (-) Transcript_19121:120-941(-)